MSAPATAAAKDLGGVPAVEYDLIGLVRQYAEAFLNAATNEGKAEAALDDLDAIQLEVLKEHPKFAQLLASSQVPAAEKDRILDQIFAGRVSDVVLRFLRVLNRHGRLSLASAVAREGRQIWDRRHKRIPVRVISAVTLDEGQQNALRERVAGMIAATPILEMISDPSLVGGLIVQVGDQVFDASVQNRLEKLRQRLIEGKTHEIQSRRDQFSDPA
jgi:F-type H+-transporting ATPase subunit delta